MVENIYWLLMKWVLNYNKYMFWGVDIYLLKNVKWEVNGVVWQFNRFLVEYFLGRMSKFIFLVGIKVRKCLDKFFRKELGLKFLKVYWMNQYSFFEGLEMFFVDEYDVLIICGMIKGLNKFKCK